MDFFFLIFFSFLTFIHSYHVYIDENGDAAGNYTVLARGLARNRRNKTVPGLVPVGTFRQTCSDKLPVSSRQGNYICIYKYYEVNFTFSCTFFFSITNFSLFLKKQDTLSGELW